MFFLTHPQHNVPFDQVSRLFIRMCMIRQNAISFQQELSHQSLLAKHECLLPDSRKRRAVLPVCVLAKHDDILLSAQR